jgi:hypothetical protein
MSFVAITIGNRLACTSDITMADCATTAGHHFAWYSFAAVAGMPISYITLAIDIAAISALLS